MRTPVILAAATAAALGASAVAHAGTLDDVKPRGYLQCGVNTGLAGFAFTDSKGNWHGFDVALLPGGRRRDLRRPDEGRVHAAPPQDALHRAASGEIDLLSRNTTWTLSRDVDLKFDLRRRELLRRPGLHGAEGARRHLGQGARRRHRLHPDRHHDRAEPRRLLPRQQHEATSRSRSRPTAEAQQKFLAGACDVYTTDASGLAATARHLREPEGLRDPARDHLQGAARPAGPPGRRGMVRHRPLDAQRADRGGGDRRHLRNVDDMAKARPTTPRSTACSAPRATSAR